VAMLPELKGFPNNSWWLLPESQKWTEFKVEILLILSCLAIESWPLFKWFLVRLIDWIFFMGVIIWIFWCRHKNKKWSWKISRSFWSLRVSRIKSFELDRKDS
jgi:hypothetical protein